MKDRETRPLVRVPTRSYRTLREMSRRYGRPMSELVAEAVERLRRERFLTEANEAYRRAGPDPDQRIWDGTLLDGLEDEDWSEHLPAETSGGTTPTRSAATSRAARGQPSSSRRTRSTRARRGSSSSVR